MSSNTTGERRWPAELTDTIRALSAAASASCSPTASAKWPRWFEANCISCPLGEMVSSGTAITPALLTRMSSGPVQARTKAATLDRSLRSSGADATCSLPVLSRISAATRSPHEVSRTASVTDAPAAASARAVSTPIPDEAPVTTAVLPVRSTPCDDVSRGRFETERCGDAISHALDHRSRSPRGVRANPAPVSAAITAARSPSSPGSNTGTPLIFSTSTDWTRPVPTRSASAPAAA